MTAEKNSRRRYTEDFKREAVALVTEHGYKVTDAARNLGIDPNRIHLWKRQFRQQAEGTRLSTDEREELQGLRRENRRLRMERDILKKPASTLRAK